MTGISISPTGRLRVNACDSDATFGSAHLFIYFPESFSSITFTMPLADQEALGLAILDAVNAARAKKTEVAA